MSKFIKFFLVITLFISSSIFLLPNKQAEAATSSWWNVKGISGCQVRVWTDYTVYTASADTIDSYLESKGNCGRLEYEMWSQMVGSATFYSKEKYKGYFSSRTPTKTFNLNTFSSKIEGFDHDGVYVYAVVWKAGKKDATYTNVQSLPLLLKKRK
ncbi:hypothetical protein MXL46_03065 [Heyndrickxia sporothermodurans]|uniref:hypothetical protein n=1 Tax=Heyndrickxia sporothermodurans TaxID=46224 RepID=UPI002DB57FAD|nr:hypothetical protein [Heyndrickxia sporothermodurans]MEB6548088.1 hypothetical protein [Heyndrickxia sporothermodurans]